MALTREVNEKVTKLVMKWQKSKSPKVRDSLFGDLEALIRKPVKNYIQKHFIEIQGTSWDDYYQIALININRVLPVFDPSVAPWSNFMWTIIFRVIATELKRVQCITYAEPYRSVNEMYHTEEGSEEFINVLRDEKYVAPLIKLANRDEVNDVFKRLYDRLSEFEQKVLLAYHKTNYSDYELVATAVGVKAKDLIKRRKIVDNALERIKNKARLLLKGEGNPVFLIEKH